MLTEPKIKRVRKYQWVLGFFGFLGFMGFSIFRLYQDSSYFLFFSFFGFFSWYWDYKLQQSIEDERLIQNKLKAKGIALRVSFGIIWIGLILTNNVLIRFFHILKEFDYRYAFITVLISLSFALGLILQSYLTYQYDTKE